MSGPVKNGIGNTACIIQVTIYHSKEVEPEASIRLVDLQTPVHTYGLCSTLVLWYFAPSLSGYSLQVILLNVVKILNRSYDY